MKLIAIIKHWFRKLIHGESWTNWLPGEPAPKPMKQETLENTYRVLVDKGIIQYGEPIFVETYAKEKA